LKTKVYSFRKLPVPTLRQLTFNAVYCLNVLLLFLAVFEEKVQLPVFLQVAGRMHPLVLHFPVTLLFLGLLIDGFLARRQPGNQSWKETLALLYGLLAVGSALTALFGFFLYKEGGYQGEQVDWHKWLGIATSLLAAAIAWLKEKANRFYFPTLLVGAVVITATGHLGAQITHGEGFLTEPLRKNREQTPGLSADSAVVFRDVIQPILNEKCAACHNPGKAKNKLILTDYAHLAKGGETKDCLVPGKAEKSLLYTYARLPMDDSLHMPPKGKPQLDEEELKLIGWWINSGAGASRAYAAMPRPDSIHPLMLARFGPKAGVELLDIPFADPGTIAALNTPYRTVQQLSVPKPYIHVFMGSRRTVSGADLQELEAVRDQIVSVDLGNTDLKDAHLRALAGFPHLKKLYLHNSPVTDEGVRHLSGLAYLEALNLSGTRITAKLLEELPRWPALKTVFLFNTGIEEAQLAALQKAAPKLKVHRSRVDVSDTLYYAQLVTPEVKVDSPFFHRAATVTVKPSRGKVNYYYTLDGSQPGKNSTRYTGPIPVRESAQLRMIAGMEGWKDSKPVLLQLLHLGVAPDKVILETAPDANYRDRLDTTLFDGIAGPVAHDEGKYLGFKGTDMRARLAFAAPRVFSKVTLSYLEAVNKAVLPPASIEVWGGEKENGLRRLGTIQTDYPAKDRPAARHLVTLALPPRPLRYVRIVARNKGSLPAWHSSAKSAKALILIDEVAIE
jgi:uncharacterized membrane protein/mono/diheme cytochrome c family protein